MSLKKKVINKGYTLEITSWENDGDYCRTKTKTVETFEEVAKLLQICTTLFKSCNNRDGGVGNSMEGASNWVLLEYVEDHPDLFPELDPNNEYEISDYFVNLAYELMGASESYDFRVCESVVVTYSPEDIYSEEIKF